MDMLFESVNGHAVPVVVPDRDPDGVSLFTLGQASAHFGIEPDVLTRMFRASWGRYIGGGDDPATEPVADVATGGAVMATVEHTIQDVRVALLKQIKYPDMAAEHFEYCIGVCRQRGFSPWADQVFFTVEHDHHLGLPVPKVIVGIHGLRLIADRTGERDGNEPPKFEKDELGNDVACTVTIYRFSNGRRCAYHGTARMAEYHPGQGMDPVWDKLPTQCLRRCAEAAALREAFVEELGGLYSVEEMAQARNRQRLAGAQRRRRESLIDTGLPSSRGMLEIFLVERMGVTNKAKRAELMARLSREFDLGEDPAGYAEAAEAVAGDQRKYGICP